MVSNKTKILVNSGLVIGAISGAIAAYFLAPQKGSETQKMLARKANNITQKSINKAQDALIKFEVALEASQHKHDDESFENIPRRN